METEIKSWSYPSRTNREMILFCGHYPTLGSLWKIQFLALSRRSANGVGDEHAAWIQPRLSWSVFRRVQARISNSNVCEMKNLYHACHCTPLLLMVQWKGRAFTVDSQEQKPLTNVSVSLLSGARFLSGMLYFWRHQNNFLLINFHLTQRS